MTKVIGERALKVANSFMPFVMHPPSVKHQNEVRDAMASTVQIAMETYWPTLNDENQKQKERIKDLEEALKESLSILEYRENAKLTGGNIFLTSTIEKVKQLLTH